MSLSFGKGNRLRPELHADIVLGASVLQNMNLWFSGFCFESIATKGNDQLKTTVLAISKCDCFKYIHLFKYLQISLSHNFLYVLFGRIFGLRNCNRITISLYFYWLRHFYQMFKTWFYFKGLRHFCWFQTNRKIVKICRKCGFFISHQNLPVNVRMTK